MVTPIEIVAYRADWPAGFRELAGRLRVALGQNATRIDHIGSTSVPGLAAKDVIDVQVTVERLDTATLRPRLEAIGLTWRADIDCDHQPPGVALEPGELRKLYAQAQPPLRTANVHIRREGRFNQRYALLCRDYLRAHPPTAAAYAEVKRRLAGRFPDSVDAYYDIKDPVFDLFMTAAEEWAGWTGWEPGPSDA